MNKLELTEMEVAVYNAVQNIRKIKRRNKMRPDFAFLYEIENYLALNMPEDFETQVIGILRTLFRRGLITHHKNVNGILMFGIKQLQYE